MNSVEKFNSSKVNDKLIIDFYSGLYPDAKLADFDEDTKGKYDITMDGKRIDTKYFSSLYYEVDKHSHSDATHLWYILNGTDKTETYLIEKNALNDLCNDIDNDSPVTFRTGKCSGQRLADFTIDMLDPSCYEIIDLSELHLI